MLTRLFKTLFALMILSAAVVPNVHAEGDVYVTQVNFIDVDNNYWANNAIMTLAKNKVINGYEDQSFRPENKVTREEFAALIAKTFYLDLPPSGAKQTYYDVPPDHWSFPYVEASKEFLTGYYPPSGKAFFSPETDATREDVAVALVKTLGYQPDDLQNPEILEWNFNDLDSISPNLRTYVALAIEKELFGGYPDGTFRGDQPISRAEVATLLFRIIKNASADGNTDIQLSVTVPETTSNGTFYVSGTTTKGATVTINNREVPVTQGQFKEGYKIDTDEGTYQIVVTARLPGGKSKTVTKEITYEKGGPDLKVNDIPEQTDKSSVTISWTATSNDYYDEVTVYVNDEAQSRYTTSKTVKLEEGENSIVVRAVNEAGKETVVTKTITFNNGGPVLKVSEVPETTDKKSITVSWTVSDKNDSYPEVYVNDELQSNYSSSITLQLQEGVNTIVFKAVNSFGKTTVVTKTVSLGTGAPTLKLGQIPSTTETASVNVSWTVSDKNDSYPKVYINDQEYSYYSTSTTLKLEPGENTFVFKAVNSSGKETAITKVITFNPPAPKLTLGYVPATTKAGFLTLTWTVSDKNDSYPKVYVNDDLQSSYSSSIRLQLTTGANPYTVLAINKFGQQTTVTGTVYKE